KSQERYFVYGLMDSCRIHGAIGVHEVTLGPSGTAHHVGKLDMEPGHRLLGRLVLADGKPVPANTPVLLSRAKAWDTQSVRVGADGTFSFWGLPSEGYELVVNLPGYHPSSKNRSLDVYRRGLVGTIARDIKDVQFLLEAGPAPAIDWNK